MDEDKENALCCALKALAVAAVNQGLTLDTLCDGAINSILDDPENEAVNIALAVAAIEGAADALVLA